MPKQLKGVILAAGFGSRLAPLTHHVPKPLLPFGDASLIDLALQRLKAVGVQEVAVNTHHLAEHLEEWASHQEGVTIFHEPEILGTLGAFAPMAKWRNQADLIIVNSDIYHSESLTPLVKHFHKTRPSVLMSTRNPLEDKATPLWVAGDSLVKIGGESPHDYTTAHSFACAQIIRSDALDLISKDTKELANTYKKWLAEGVNIQVLPSEGLWFDLGTPEDYYHAHLAFAQKAPHNWLHVPAGQKKHFNDLTIEGPCLVAKDNLSGGTGYIGPGSIIYPKNHFRRFNVRQSLLLPETHCQDTESIDHQIRYQNIAITL